jgi:TolB-like protein
MERIRAFGPFRFDSRGGELTGEGGPIALGGRGAALLDALLAANGGVVRKSELIEAAWSGVVVEERNLTVQIAALRKALGDRADGQPWIRTVSRVGYRLVRDMQPQPLVSYTPSLVVLPFANLSGDAEQEYFADGVVAEIITALSRFRSFAVVARNSSFVYKGRTVDVRGVASELGVRYVLEGSVQKAGDRLRITAQLLDGATGAYLWGQIFDGRFEDVFDFQDRITESVVIVIEPQIQRAEVLRSRQRRPGNLVAYDLYLQAVPIAMRATIESNDTALALLERAIELDPCYAIAVVSVAWVLEHRIAMGWPAAGADDRERCLDMARAAMALAPDDPLVLAHGGRCMQVAGRDYDGGLMTVTRAVRANPNHAHVILCAGAAHLQGGDLDQAMPLFRRLASLDLLETFVAQTCIAQVEMCRGNYELALESAHQSLAANPYFDPTHWIIMTCYAHLGRAEEARSALATYLSIVPTMTLRKLRVSQHTKDPHRATVLLNGLHKAGMPET